VEKNSLSLKELLNKCQKISKQKKSKAQTHMLDLNVFITQSLRVVALLKLLLSRNAKLKLQLVTELLLTLLLHQKISHMLTVKSHLRQEKWKKKFRFQLLMMMNGNPILTFSLNFMIQQKLQHLLSTMVSQTKMVKLLSLNLR